MADSFDLIVKGGTVVNHDGTGRARHRHRATAASPPSAGSARPRPPRSSTPAGLHVLPGVIDTQVHFREPGLEQKEDLETGSRAAVMGGVTAVFEMPNTKPLTTSAETLADKCARARHRMFCDFAFYVGGTRENVGRHPRAGAAARLAPASRCSWAPPPATCWSRTSRRSTASSPRITRRAAFHSEDEARLRERARLARQGDPSSHPVWRDEEAAMIATAAAVRLAEKHGKRIHVLHVSTARGDGVPGRAQGLGQRRGDAASSDPGGARLLRAARHLCADEPAGARRAPPRRRSGPASPSGVVDVLGSDHAPHTREEKDHPYPESHSGMTGVQTLVPIMLDHVNAGRLTPGALRRPHQRTARSACSASAARAASRSAMTPTSPSST